MKRFFHLVILTFMVIALQAQTGTWRAYLSYAEPQQIIKAGQRLYVRASNDLYSYNLKDQSITTYDRVRSLNDTYISLIAWNQQVQKLIIVYKNSNIDLMDANDNVYNLSAIYEKSMTQDKTINTVIIYQQYAYIGMGFGIVKVNMQKDEIVESYIINKSIKDIAINDQHIYAKTSDNTVLTASLKDNLINPQNWTVATGISNSLFNKNTSDWDTYLEQVKTLKPDGPKYNYFHYMKYMNNQLYSCGGGWIDGGEFRRPYISQLFDNNEWKFYDEATPLKANKYYDATCIVYDPNDVNHVFIGTCGTGLYEYQDGKCIANYTQGNSPFKSALDSIKYPNSFMNYVRVDGLVFDKHRKLWMTNSSENTLVSYDLNTKEWKVYDNNLLSYNDNPLRILRQAFLDSRGYIYYFNDHHSLPCMIRVNTETAQITRYTNFINQDGSKASINYVRCGAEDKDGNIWMGTSGGLFMYTESQLENTELGFTQIKVPRNDGSDFADYLLDGVNITCMAIDGGNRKWIGTDGNGIYLISADNMQQIHHFTYENSSLLSNLIESITINDHTGEIFIGTDNGLCSYMSDATISNDQMDKDDVYAYPNPVEPGYEGIITVVGLSFDADVKILSPSGKLVAEGRSNGGTFTWNGCDTKGHRVASGVYMVAVANSDGSKGIVTKIAIVR